ncbi:unnamed protein product [Mytilus coruscus]|uniref:B box-type domain-containing protein n=1 Tax=Mytilus coruscus TaxID=42192 RepID=A0A6J8D0D2_MYTCO|nr:unnamed protein product [Mytilus coruscus]
MIDLEYLCIEYKIYATDYSNDAVSCYTFEGKILWQFRNESILKCLIRIAVDNNSNVYVTAYKCVICIYPDGKKFKTFEASKDGLSDPKALHFHCTQNKLNVPDRDMTTRSEDCCGICKAREITKEANNWCCDCGEGLCFDCHDIHVNSKSSSNHDTIPIEKKTKVAIDEEIVAIKKYATEYQVYIGSKTIENKVEKEATYLQSLLEDGTLRQNRLKLTMNEKLSNIESIIGTFGTVETEIGQTLIVLKRRKNKQAQIMSNIPNIDKIEIAYVGQIKLPSSMVWSWIFKSFELQGIIILPDGKMILADSYYKRLLIVNNDGRWTSQYHAQ